MLSPWSSPRVFDLPVSWCGTYQESIMIDVVLVTIAEQSALVIWPVGSTDWNSHWLLKNSSKDLFTAFGIVPACNFEWAALDFALLDLGDVRVSVFGLDAVVFDIVESFVVVTVMTTQVTIAHAAIHQLLFWKINCLILAQSQTFQWGHSAESPSWSAISLALDWWYHAFLSPVDIFSHFWDNQVLWFYFRNYLSGIKVSLNELILSQSRKLCNSQLVSLTWICVVFFELFQVGVENDLPERLLSRSKLHVELFLKSLELIRFLNWMIEHENGQDACCNCQSDQKILWHLLKINITLFYKFSFL